MSEDNQPGEHKAKGKALVLPSNLYDVGKFVALVLLPGIGTLYFALAQIWGLPKPEEVVGTITVVDTFLGGVLHISSQQYNKVVGKPKMVGTIRVTDTGVDSRNYTLDLGNNHPDDSIAPAKSVMFKVDTSGVAPPAEETPQA